MPRGFVFPTDSPAGAALPAAAGAAPSPKPDEYAEKLLKYVPAEVIAFFIPATATADANDHALLVVIFVVAAIGALGYLYRASLSVPADKRGKWWSYPLALAAFTAWALGTSPATADVVDIAPKTGGFILLIAAFVIPLADSIITAKTTE